MIRLLVIDAYDPAGRRALESCGGTRAGRLYANSLRAFDDRLQLEVVEVGESSEPLPDPASGYDGVVWTGSNLTIHRSSELVSIQLDFARKAFAAGVPQFGSCWAIQIATVAAGGKCARNPKGREFGIARDIEKTADGREHPLLAGRPLGFDSFASHEDIVVELPAGAVHLARNAFCEIQAAEVRYGAGVFWAVQYHPEYDFHEVSSLALLRREQLVREGRFADDDEAAEFAADFAALHRDPALDESRRRQHVSSSAADRTQRRSEIDSWLRAVRSGDLRS